MAEVFGDPADFAIEAGVEPDKQTASTVWGHMCVWCLGVALGDIDERYCGIHHAATEFHWLSRNLDTLWDDELAGFDDIGAWNFLDGLLYGYHGDIELSDDRTLEECSRDAARWSRFDFLTNWGEQFDGYKAFLLRPPGDSVRVLYRRPDNTRGVTSVSRRGFIESATGFVEWFADQSPRLGVPFVRSA